MDVAKKLTPLQHRFIAAYLGEGYENATESARLAGYAPKGARQQAYALLHNPNFAHVADELARQKRDVLKRINNELIPACYMRLAKVQAFRPNVMIQARDEGIESLTKDEQDCLQMSLKVYDSGSFILCKAPDLSQNLSDILKLRKALSDDVKPEDDGQGDRVRGEIESILDRLGSDLDEADAREQAIEEESEATEEE